MTSLGGVLKMNFAKPEFCGYARKFVKILSHENFPLYSMKIIVIYAMSMHETERKLCVTKVCLE